METGTILIDPKTGLKLLVVNSPSEPIDPNNITIEGRPVEIVEPSIGGLVVGGIEMIIDPGQRG